MQKSIKNLFNGKFREDPHLFKRYNEIIKDQIESRIIERAPGSHIVGKIHYLPHKLVVRDEKVTTELRIVFDASAKANGSHSFNDCLYPGPSLTASLFGVLLRFRIRNIAFLGDIEKAFLQIGYIHHAETLEDSYGFKNQVILILKISNIMS